MIHTASLARKREVLKDNHPPDPDIEHPPGGKCDITTLAQQAGVDRTAFYGTRPYTHLREEFETD